MKISFVSSAAVSHTMRYQMQRMQADLAASQQEMTSGRVADAGLALGARTGQSVSFARDVERLGGIVDSNSMIASRLSSTQTALSQITEVGRTFLGTLTSANSGDVSAGVARTDAQAMLQSLTSVVNQSLNGEYLFAGINTDVQPLADYTAAGSPAKAAFDAAFLAHFGFAKDDPAAAGIDAGQITAFIDTALDPLFLGAGWSGTWSSATDETIVSRIALNETTQSSVSANNPGVRKLAMAAAMIYELFDSPIGEGARAAVAERAVELVGEALGNIASTQSETGIIEQRVANATERLEMQVSIFKRSILNMEGVDPYEASTRVTALLAQIETSYMITARLQQLSLVRFLT